jgi:hypothetical protein
MGRSLNGLLLIRAGVLNGWLIVIPLGSGRELEETQLGSLSEVTKWKMISVASGCASALKQTDHFGRDQGMDDSLHLPTATVPA